MPYTTKSLSSFDTNDYIDLDTALVPEELRSLGATPETIDYNNDNYRISFKNMNTRETERLRDALVTPLSNSPVTIESLLKIPVDSCSESVALFKNLANDDHIDLVSSDLKDFMDNCDLDDLMSRSSSRPSAFASPLQPYRHSKDGLTSSRLNTHNRAEQKKHQETKLAAAESTLLQKLSEPHQQEHKYHYPENEDDEPSGPSRHTNHDGYSNPVAHTHKPASDNINDSVNTNKYEPPMSVLDEKPKNRTMHSILKRRSIDSDGLKRLQQPNAAEEPTSIADNKLLSKRHSMLSITEYKATPARSKLPTTVQRRNSSLQQPVVSTATFLKRRDSNTQQTTTAAAPLQRRNSNLQQPVVSTATLVKRRDSNMQQTATAKAPLQRRNSNLMQPVVSTATLVKRRDSNMQQTATAKAPLQRRDSNTQQTATAKALLQRRNSNLQQPVVSTATLVKRRDSNMQQTATATAPLQRRNSNLQQSSNMQRRDSSNTAHHAPVEPKVICERRNSRAQQQEAQQPDRRRWSSYIPGHTVVTDNQMPHREMLAPQRTSRQEPRKLLNRHSMLLPSSARQYSREKEEEEERVVYEAPPTISQRQRVAREQDVYDSETSSPPLQVHAQSTSAERVRRRHTLSASDERASMGQLLPQHTANKRVSLHVPTRRAHATLVDDYDDDDQMDIVPQVQQRRVVHSDKRPHHIKTSSYEWSIEEPNRYRGTLRNPVIHRDYESQQSSSLRTPVLANSRQVSPREYQHHTTRLSKRSELQLQSNHNEAARYRHEPSELVYSQAYDYEQVDEDLITPSSSRYVSRDLDEQRHHPLPTTATTALQQRRNRALPSLPAPSNHHHQATDKPSLMPVPVRYHKHNTNIISKYTSVPENEGLASFSPPRETRLYPEEMLQVEASRSSGGLSNSTVSSTHSNDRYYDPPTPPINAVNTTAYGSYGKRRSVPVMNASIIDDPVLRKTENRYSSYLSRIKKDTTMMAEHEDISPASRRLVPRRQRVLTEDNDNYRQQMEQHTSRRSPQHQQQASYRDEDTEDVISSAKRLLSIVKERRNRAHH